MLYNNARKNGSLDSPPDLLTVIPLQMPCIRATSLPEYRKSYEFWLYLLKLILRMMKMVLLPIRYGACLPARLRWGKRRPWKNGLKSSAPNLNRTTI